MPLPEVSGAWLCQTVWDAPPQARGARGGVARTRRALLKQPYSATARGIASACCRSRFAGCAGAGSCSASAGPRCDCFGPTATDTVPFSASAGPRCDCRGRVVHTPVCCPADPPCSRGPGGPHAASAQGARPDRSPWHKWFPTLPLCRAARVSPVVNQLLNTVCRAANRSAYAMMMWDGDRLSREGILCVPSIWLPAPPAIWA